MSAALIAWRGSRKVRLDRLDAAHALLRQPGSSGGVHTEYLNWALLLAVASEFHAYTRDLHDLAVKAFVTRAAPANAAVGTVLRARLTEGRVISRANPQPDALASDFGRFGFHLWKALDAAHPGNDWAASLAMLMSARNAVAHGDVQQLAAVRARGFGISAKNVTRWRRDLDALAGAMDAATSAHLASLFRTAKPW